MLSNAVYGGLHDRIHRTNIWQMIRRQAKDVGIATPIGCHTFRATSITN